METGVRGSGCEYCVLVNLGSAVLCTTVSDPVSASPGRGGDEVVSVHIEDILCESCIWELWKVVLLL